MADLSPSRRLRQDDRGQVILIAGFLLAASFVALALVLNSVIYTENIATRAEEARGTDAIAYRADMVAGAEQLIEYANENQTGFGTIQDGFEEGLQSLNNRTATQQAVDGTFAEVSFKGATQGTRIGQENPTRNFTNVTGATEWELANTVDATRAFRINVTDSDELAEDGNLGLFGGGEDAFNVTVTDGSTDWRVRLYKDSDGSLVSDETILDVEGAGQCTAGEDPTVDLTAGTFNGTSCEALNFAEGVSAPYRVSFGGADEVLGNFSVVVDSTSYEAANYDSNTDTPFAVEAIYAATIHVTYESSTLDYETDARAVPGENDD